MPLGPLAGLRDGAAVFSLALGGHCAFVCGGRVLVVLEVGMVLGAVT